MLSAHRLPVIFPFLVRIELKQEEPKIWQYKNDNELHQDTELWTKLQRFFGTWLNLKSVPCGPWGPGGPGGPPKKVPKTRKKKWVLYVCDYYYKKKSNKKSSTNLMKGQSCQPLLLALRVQVLQCLSNPFQVKNESKIKKSPCFHTWLSRRTSTPR